VLAGRVVVAVLVLTMIGLSAGLFTWVGTASTGVGLRLSTLLAAGLNVVPVGVLVLGLGTLVHGWAPRLASPMAYAVVAWSFLVEIVGAGPGAGSGWKQGRSPRTTAVAQGLRVRAVQSADRHPHGGCMVRPADPSTSVSPRIRSRIRSIVDTTSNLRRRLHHHRHSGNGYVSVGSRRCRETPQPRCPFARNLFGLPFLVLHYPRRRKVGR
jgi:hypothetical protein